jgi:hypothetical protein
VFQTWALSKNTPTRHFDIQAEVNCDQTSSLSPDFLSTHIPKQLKSKLRFFCYSDRFKKTTAAAGKLALNYQTKLKLINSSIIKVP